MRLYLLKNVPLQRFVAHPTESCEIPKLYIKLLSLNYYTVRFKLK